jgi:hypothetical protein
MREHDDFAKHAGREMSLLDVDIDRTLHPCESRAKRVLLTRIELAPKTDRHDVLPLLKDGSHSSKWTYVDYGKARVQWTPPVGQAY